MNRQFFIVLTLCFWALASSQAQKPTLEYYLPGVVFDPKIPSPAAYLGYETGEWHTSHDQLVGYMRLLASVSPRIQLREYGRTHERRPLLSLTISSPENLARLEEIRTERMRFIDPREGASMNPADFPAVHFMGYSVHGNEASGSHAALIMAYYLAAAQGDEIEKTLKNTIILFDPCFNPDGMQRFTGWVNSRRSAHLRPDPNDDEFNEHWPGGRFNHYWFDLNRDWLVCQQPESGGRVDIFQDWTPNVLTDHHEMGSNATFFFQPGVPSRVNPITPARNQQLTAEIALYHTRTLNEKGILYYTAEGFDDFYYGKGSTYPDAQGCIGILFEQASSRGSAQDTDNGLLSFPFTIRNQVLTSMSTLKAVTEMRVELNTYLRDFFRTALEEARRDQAQGYVMAQNDHNPLPVREFIDLLRRHHIEVYETSRQIAVNGQTFDAGAWYVPVQQRQYRLIRGVFERLTQFQDSIFYDISAWTLPDAFGLRWSSVPRDISVRLAPEQKQEKVVLPPAIDTARAYAFVVDGEDYRTPMLLNRLLRQGVRVKVAAKPFTADGRSFREGALLISTDRQTARQEIVMDLLRQSGCAWSAIGDGYTSEGPDLGSASFKLCRLPKVLIATGKGVNALNAGEIWHLLDIRYDMSPTLVETTRWGELNLSKYTTIVLPDGTYTPEIAEKLRQFTADGGVVIAIGQAVSWLKTNNLCAVEWRPVQNNVVQPNVRRSYSALTEDKAALNMPGAIFKARADLSHPICWGFREEEITIFHGDNLFAEKTQNPYATPLAFAEKDPLLAGYIHPSQRAAISGAAAITVSGAGRGRVIAFVHNPCFRAFWYGTDRLLANAIFFGSMIESGALEKK